MATWDNVRGFALALPETSEGTHFGGIAWRVKDKMFVFERPLRKGDIAALGANAPPGPILAARVDHEGIKHALIAENPENFEEGSGGVSRRRLARASTEAAG